MITMLGCLERLKVVIGSLRMVRGWLLARLHPYPESRIFEVSGRISLANSLAATPSSEDLKPFSHALLPPSIQSFHDDHTSSPCGISHLRTNHCFPRLLTNILRRPNLRPGSPGLPAHCGPSPGCNPVHTTTAIPSKQPLTPPVSLLPNLDRSPS
jgi:hypothetical protein